MNEKRRFKMEKKTFSIDKILKLKLFIGKFYIFTKSIFWLKQTL